MTLEFIDLNDPKLEFTFSNCVVAGDFVFTAHHAGYDREADKWPEGIEAQMEQCFKNLERTLQAAGVSLETVVKTTVFFKNLEDFQGIRAAHRRVFKYGFPARSALITQFLDSECLVQIEAVAYRG